MFCKIGFYLRKFAEKDGRGYPDWALRYIPIRARIHRFLKEQRIINPRILEVGGNECCLAKFSPLPLILVNYSIDELIDACKYRAVRAVAADAKSLPFPEGKFDIVLCVDTLEHISPQERCLVLQSIVRQLKPQGIGVITFPSGANTRDAEKHIAIKYWEHTGNHLVWFEEHAIYGLPELQQVCEILKEVCDETHVVLQRWRTPIWLWTIVWKILLCGWPGRGNAVFQALLRVFAGLLSRLPTKNGYRVEIWLIPKQN